MFSNQSGNSQAHIYVKERQIYAHVANPVQFIHRGFTSLQSRPTTHGRQQKRPGAQGDDKGVAFLKRLAGLQWLCKDFQRVTMCQKRMMMIMMMYCKYIIEGNLEVKLPTIR